MSSLHHPSRAAVLIVEDDALLRISSVDIVEDAGFSALEASNADEAIAILEARNDVVLLVTDIQMPGSMDGLKLARAVSNRWPPIKILIVSGRIQVSDDDLPPNSRFLGKPFGSDELMLEVRGLMRGLSE